MLRHRAAGFTLIELLTVVAIIGVLSAVVLSSLNSARAKGRDAKRVSDIKQLQLALELYFDAHSAYPSGSGTVAATLAPLTTDGLISTLPSDPSGAPAAYGYIALPNGCGGMNCVNYVIGALLESGNHTAVQGDWDNDQSITINGGNENCNALAGQATEVVFCATP